MEFLGLVLKIAIHVGRSTYSECGIHVMYGEKRNPLSLVL